MLSHVQLSETLWTVAHQALSMGLSRTEYWSGLPFPTPEDLPHPEIEPASVSCIAGRFFIAASQGSPEGISMQRPKVYKSSFK